MRSLNQNRMMWANLEDIAQQVVWDGGKLTKDDWKDVLTAALKKQKVVPGIEGGFVVIGARTSKMTVPEMTELIELSTAFGTQQGVKFRAFVDD
jgi:ABC-type enterobactin transport system permease subunit